MALRHSTSAGDPGVVGLNQAQLPRSSSRWPSKPADEDHLRAEIFQAGIHITLDHSRMAMTAV
jgi:hypothetical protein